MLKDIPKPRPDQNVTRSGFVVNNKTMILTKYSSIKADTLYVGGKNNKFCLEVRIPYDGSQGNLPHIDYDVTCSIDNNFARGVDTNSMLNRMLHYIGINYPHIVTLRFSDSSNRTCDNGQTIELSEMGYITTGKTWYERHYGAYLEEYDQIKFNKCDALFQRRKTEWSWSDVNMEIDFRNLYPVISEDELHKLYDASTTWQQFFGQIANRIGVSKFCIFAVVWLHTFLFEYMKFTFSFASYIMPIPSVANASINYITALPNKMGGTRKRFKSRIRRVYF